MGEARRRRLFKLPPRTIRLDEAELGAAMTLYKQVVDIQARRHEPQWTWEFFLQQTYRLGAQALAARVAVFDKSDRLVLTPDEAKDEAAARAAGG